MPRAAKSPAPTARAAPPRPAEAAALPGVTPLNRLADAAHIRTVFGEPVVHGATVIIPAAEVVTVAGFGRGQAGRGAPEVGEGSGGGGWTITRPVGVVVVTGDDVRVLLLVDVNKIILTALPIFGVVAALALRLRARR